MSNVAEAIATLMKVLSEQPEKAQTKRLKSRGHRRERVRQSRIAGHG